MPHLPEDQGVRLRHLPKEAGHAVTVQTLEAAHSLVAVDDHVRLGATDDHDRRLLTVFRQRGQKSALALRLSRSDS
jgi:hypothetical protein